MHNQQNKIPQFVIVTYPKQFHVLCLPASLYPLRVSNNAENKTEKK
jgi:hypothetical protein